MVNSNWTKGIFSVYFFSDWLSVVMAGRRRTKTEPAGASANNSLTEDDPELVAENNKDESEKNGAGKASTSSTTGMA